MASEIAVEPGGGREIAFGPNRLHVKIDAVTGSRDLMVLESSFPPGAGSGLRHVHQTFEEAFWVLEGEIEYHVGETRVRAKAGSCVYIPAGVPHSFTNVGAGSARHLAIATNALVAAAIEELGRVGRERFAEVLARYDSALAEEG
jgi:uncharacterized cupin superfamily protein